MTKATRIVFVGAVILFLAHQISQKLLGWSIPVVDDYLDCLLCPLLLLPAFEYEQRLLWGIPRLSLARIVLATLLLALISEIVFPRLSDGFTADWLDALAFAVGGAVYAVTSRLGTYEVREHVVRHRSGRD